MAHYFITLFVGQHACQYKLDDVLQNLSHGYLDESFLNVDAKLYIPITKEGDRYYIDNRSSLWSFRDESNGLVLNGKVLLQNKMYVVAQSERYRFAFVLMNYNACTVSSAMYEIRRGEQIFIGRSSSMNIRVNVGMLEKKHAVLYRKDNGDLMIETLTNNTNLYINGERKASCRLLPGDVVYLMEFSLVCCAGGVVIPDTIQTNNMLRVAMPQVLSVPGDFDFERPYTRNPRIYKSLSDETVSIEAPPEPEKKKSAPFILSMGPSITMAMAMLASFGVTLSNAVKTDGSMASVITSGIMTVSMLLGSLFWPKMLRSYEERRYLAEEEFRRNRYTQYLDEKEAEIARYMERNIRVWNENLFPAPKELIGFVEQKNYRLWERSYGDKDFLEVRLGLGNRPFEVTIKAPDTRFRLQEDPMLNEAFSRIDRYHTIRNVPITLSLYDQKVVGAVGDIYRIAKALITDITTLHSPDEVKIVMIYHAKRAPHLSFADNFPHMWSSDRKNRYVAVTPSEVYSMFQSMDEMMRARVDSESKDTVKLPHYVVLVFDSEMVADIPFRRYLISEENYGISTVFLEKRYQNIPKECRAIIQEQDDGCGIYIKNENHNQFVDYLPDKISEGDIRSLVSAMASVKVKIEKTAASVPERATFLDVYRVGNIESLDILNRWRNNASHKTLAAPIGLRAGGDVFSLDIHEKYHGCHGLVAGTTGSGKSEFLQAYILSMMINYSPNEVSFVLVDFKGADMARPFLDSPHLAATISNLSDQVLYRALISLDAEVKYRQNLFNDATQRLRIDKIDINSYQKYFKENVLHTPLPHLIVVIDEFAQLKTKYPDILSKLVDIAQVGRSLGIHLILATQKPSGVVDPQIWSNSRFKVCLKVTDRQDSSDMIRRPDAASIKQPGRAYVQVGYDEIFDLIQAGYSGAGYVPQNEYVDLNSITVSMINHPAEALRSAANVAKGVTGKYSQIQEIMSEIRSIGLKTQIKTAPLWLPPLEDQLVLDECIFDPDVCDRDIPGKVSIGLMDIPKQKAQPPFEIDLIRDGHLAIYGASGTGKSTMLQTIIYALSLKYSPKLFHLFVFDFNGGSLIESATMPHCIDYVTESDERAVMRTLNKLKAIADQRRELFKQHSCTNYHAYVSAGNDPLPMILVALDGYSAIRAKNPEETLLELIPYAHSCGIIFLITGNNKDAIFYKTLQHITAKLAFNLHDQYAYSGIFNIRPSFEAMDIRGRAFVAYGAENKRELVEVQIAVPFDSESEATRRQRVLQIYKDMADRYEKPRDYDGLVADEFSEDAVAQQSSTASTVSARTPAPSPAKKKLNQMPALQDGVPALVLGTLIVDANRVMGIEYTDETRIFVGDPHGSVDVPSLAKQCLSGKRTVYLVTDKTYPVSEEIHIVEDLDRFVNDIEAKKLGHFAIVIDGFSDFYDHISDEALAVFERLLGDNDFPVVTVDDLSRLRTYSSMSLYLTLVKCKSGMIVGGKVWSTMGMGLSADCVSIPENVKELPLQTHQAFLYHTNQFSHIDIAKELRTE